MARIITEKQLSRLPANANSSGISKGIDMDFEKLTADCITARGLAIKANAESDDGGTCNIDSTFLPLEKGQRTEKVLVAIKNAGLSAHATKWIGRGIMISPPGEGQANKRYVSNKALIDSLAKAGWPVLGYFQMD